MTLRPTPPAARDRVQEPSTPAVSFAILAGLVVLLSGGLLYRAYGQILDPMVQTTDSARPR